MKREKFFFTKIRRVNFIFKQIFYVRRNSLLIDEIEIFRNRINSQKKSTFNRNRFYRHDYLHKSRYCREFDETNFNNDIFDKQTQFTFDLSIELYLTFQFKYSSQIKKTTRCFECFIAFDEFKYFF